MEEEAKYLEDFYRFVLELERELLRVGPSGQEKVTLPLKSNKTCLQKSAILL